MNPFLATNPRHGTTLMEVVISIGVAGFIFSTAGFLVFMSSRNAINVRDQLIAQYSAASAGERIASILRGADHFDRFSDDTAVTVTRILVTVNDSETTQLVCHDQVKQEVMWFADASQASFSKVNGKDTVSGTPDLKYVDIPDCQIVWESLFRLQIQLGFTYRGFALMLQDPGNPQYGSFITDVIAKSHYPDGGTNYVSNSGNPFRLEPLPADRYY